ncbi:serine protease [Mycoplasmoides gallisepticum]|uniref:serine protease n=1 Tax=Mycoplasmoides gallisepticum TaxID=2096 RepID=UPI002989A149|nr:serine protease [Mycoplasmoides gallisepticum]
MKIKKITSIISLAIITPAVPLFATFNNDKTGKLSDSKRTYNRNYGLVNNSLEINKQDINPSEDLYGGSYDELYDFENNDYYQGFITFNGDFRVYDNNNILKLIKKQPVVVNASISKAIQGYYLVEIVFKKGSDDYNKFERFLKTNNLVGDFYIIDVEPEYKPNVILRDIPFSPFNEISGGTTKYLDRYQPNFESNNYDKIERINAINETSRLLSSNNKRVGVAVLKIG